MAESKQTSTLLDFALATFHTSFFFALFVFIAYVGGALANLLASLNTLIGLALYAVLWLTTWLTTRRARHALNWNSLVAPLDWVKMLGVSVISGGANGVLFFVALLLFGVIFLFVTMIASFLSASPPHPDPTSVLAGAVAFTFSAALVVAFGSIFAFIIGGVIGLIYGIIDGIIIRAAQHFFPAAQTSMLEPTTDKEL